jgi:hypothetical protein
VPQQPEAVALQQPQAIPVDPAVEVAQQLRPGGAGVEVELEEVLHRVEAAVLVAEHRADQRQALEAAHLEVGLAGLQAGGRQVQQRQLRLGGHAGHVLDHLAEAPVKRMRGTQVPTEGAWQLRTERVEAHRSPPTRMPAVAARAYRATVGNRSLFSPRTIV